MRILVLNPGSSSLKFQLRETDYTGPAETVLRAGQVDWRPGAGETDAPARRAFDEMEAAGPAGPGSMTPQAIGHRVVHGGERFTEPVRVTADVVQAIKDLGALAPLHNASSAACMEVAAERWPDVPQVAVFDTSFHRTLPDYASHYAIPEDLYTGHPVRRYGFHGMSVEMACKDTAAFLHEAPATVNAVVAHIGNGASVTAVRAGASVDTSMGMTPLEGLVMGTRAGDLDPSIALLAQHNGTTADEVSDVLNHRSGLLALAGTPDMRKVEQAARRGEPGAVLALDMAAYRLAKYIAAYSMVVGRPHALVFTGGIGENSPVFRSRVISWLDPLGLSLDDQKNTAADTGVRVVSTAVSRFPVLVVPSDEERAIAQATAGLLAGTV